MCMQGREGMKIGNLGYEQQRSHNQFIHIPRGCLEFDTREIQAQKGQVAYFKPHSSKWQD